MSPIIYADLESLIKRKDGCKNKFEKWSTVKVGKQIPCGYSIPMLWTCDGIEDKDDV